MCLEVTATVNGKYALQNHKEQVSVQYFSLAHVSPLHYVLMICLNAAAG